MEQQRADDADDESTGRVRAACPDIEPRVAPTDASSAAPSRPAPLEYLRDLTELALIDPVAAGDHVGDLLVLSRHDAAAVRESAGEALDLVGQLRPVEFEVWAADLVSLAGVADDGRAFLGLRALAQLAGANPRAAACGLDVAFSHVGAPDTDLRRAALVIVAEVGGADPDLVRRADRHVVTALVDPCAEIRLTGAIAAGKLLGAAPGRFPRSATALFDALDDPVDEVWEFAHVALVHFACEHPAQVPNKGRAIETLARVSDADIGVREGATKEALSSVLAVERGFER